MAVDRLGFIDFARGLVMMLIAWDHVSGFWNQVHGGLEGIYAYRNPSLDFTLSMSRFITTSVPRPSSSSRGSHSPSR